MVTDTQILVRDMDPRHPLYDPHRLTGWELACLTVRAGLVLMGAVLVGLVCLGPVELWRALRE